MNDARNNRDRVGAAPAGSRGRVDLEAPPPPWDYDPSSWNQRVRVAVVAIPGVLISIYLGLFQWGLVDSVWDPVFGQGSQRVLTSEVSHGMSRWIRVPDAVLGALAYLGDILFALAGSTRRWQYRPWLVIVFGIDVIPLGIVSVILVILQGTVVGSWCFLCLVTAVISIALIMLAYDEVRSSIQYLWFAYKRADDFGQWWGTFWGRPSENAHRAAEDFLQQAAARRAAVRS